MKRKNIKFLCLIASVHFGLLLTVLLVISCGPQPRNIVDKTKIDGRVINRITQEPIVGASVIVTEFTYRYPVPSSRKQVAQTMTDTDGKFNLRFAASLGISTTYELNIFTPDSLQPGIKGELASYEVVKHQHNYPQFEIIPNSLFDLELNPSNCTSGDLLTYSVLLEFEEGHPTFPSNYVDNCNSTVDNDRFRTIPAGDAYIRWEIDGVNGLIEEFHDTLFCPPGEEVEYVIVY
ncbi:MAG: hypothetical protein AAF655_10405 [Bacteroidota bacterium]